MVAQETFVAKLLRHFGEGSFGEDMLSFKFMEGVYPMHSVDSEYLNYGSKWKIHIADGRFKIIGVELRRSVIRRPIAICIED